MYKEKNNRARRKAILTLAQHQSRASKRSTATTVGREITVNVGAYTIHSVPVADISAMVAIGNSHVQSKPKKNKVLMMVGNALKKSKVKSFIQLGEDMME